MKLLKIIFLCFLFGIQQIAFASPNISERNFLYVADAHQKNISICNSDPVTAKLICSITVGDIFNSAPISIAINPKGTFAYIVELDGIITICRIQQNTGDLIDCSKDLPNGYYSRPEKIVINPTNTFAYIINGYGDYLSFCSINQNTGKLSDCKQFSKNISNYSGRIAISPNGAFSYVSSIFNGSLAVCSVDSNTGDLDCSHTIANVFMGYTDPDVEINSSGTFLYVTNWRRSSITVCSVNKTTGDLNCNLDGAGYLPNARIIAINQNNTFAYVASHFYDSGTGNSYGKFYLCNIEQTSGRFNCSEVTDMNFDVNHLSAMTFLHKAS